MKALKVFGVILLLLVVAISGYATQTLYRLDLLVNPINRYLYFELPFLSGPRVQMIPQVFAPGTPLVEIEQRLSGAGFERIETDHPFARGRCREVDIDNVNCGPEDNALGDQLKTGTGQIMYVREAARVPCNFEWYVYFKSDANNEVNSVEAAVYESGCL